MNDDEKAIVKSNESTGEKAWNLAQRQARCWADSTLVPATYQGNIPNVIIATEVANQIGMSPLAVMQSLYIVKGKPAFEAKFLIATVNACGKFSPLRYKFQGTEGQDDWGCRAHAVDKAGEELFGPLVTIALAKAEGWYSKSQSKWQTMPELMLMYRSAAWWARVYAPELSLGLQTEEEVKDIGPAQVVSRPTTLDAVVDQIEEQASESETVETDPLQAELLAVAQEKWGEEANTKLIEYATQQGYSLSEHTSLLLDALLAEHEESQ
jgi:hypothetical protein